MQKTVPLLVWLAQKGAQIGAQKGAQKASKKADHWPKANNKWPKAARSNRCPSWWTQRALV